MFFEFKGQVAVMMFNSYVKLQLCCSCRVEHLENSSCNVQLLCKVKGNDVDFKRTPAITRLSSNGKRRVMMLVSQKEEFSFHYDNNLL